MISAAQSITGDDPTLQLAPMTPAKATPTAPNVLPLAGGAAPSLPATPTPTTPTPTPMPVSPAPSLPMAPAERPAPLVQNTAMPTASPAPSLPMAPTPAPAAPTSPANGVTSAYDTSTPSGVDYINQLNAQEAAREQAAGIGGVGATHTTDYVNGKPVGDTMSQAGNPASQISGPALGQTVNGANGGATFADGLNLAPANPDLYKTEGAIEASKGQAPASQPGDTGYAGTQAVAGATQQSPNATPPAGGLLASLLGRFATPGGGAATPTDAGGMTPNGALALAPTGQTSAGSVQGFATGANGSSSPFPGAQASGPAPAAAPSSPLTLAPSASSAAPGAPSNAASGPYANLVDSSAPGGNYLGQTIQPGTGTDRLGIAQSMFDTFQKSSDPAYQAAVREAESNGAALGQLGSGGLRTSVGNLANQRGQQLEAERSNLTNQALTGSIDDAYKNIGIAQQQQGFQAGQQNTAFNQAATQAQIQEALTQGDFNRAAALLAAGNTGNPSDTALQLANSYGNQASQAGAAASGLVTNSVNNSAQQLSQAQMNQILAQMGRPPVGSNSPTMPDPFALPPAGYNPNTDY